MMVVPRSFRQVAILHKLNPETYLSDAQLGWKLGDYDTDDPRHDPIVRNAGQVELIAIPIGPLGRRYVYADIDDFIAIDSSDGRAFPQDRDIWHIVSRKKLLELIVTRRMEDGSPEEQGTI